MSELIDSVCHVYDLGDKNGATIELLCNAYNYCDVTNGRGRTIIF